VGAALQSALDSTEDTVLSDAPYDQRLVNDATAVEQCMKLGAVILKPQGQRPLGFSQPPPTPDGSSK
jgi:hypothetical protein